MEDVECASTTTITTITDESDEVTETGFESSCVSTSDTNDNTNNHFPSHIRHMPSIRHAVGDEDIRMESDSNSNGNSAPSEINNKNSNANSDNDFGDRAGKSTEHWYQNECFNRYWRHYAFVSLWCQRHMQVYRSVCEQFRSELSQQPVTTEVPTSRTEADKAIFKKPVALKTQRNRKARRRRKEAKKRMRLALVQREPINSYSESAEAGEATGSGMDRVEEEIEMDFSEEMLDFFAHTHRHRVERDALKSQNKGRKEERLTNIEEVRSDKKELTVDAPKERPGSRRTEEMLFLYGKGAAMIHGMETALQMNFDRNLDVKQPKLWPNMPFKILFG